MWVGGIPRPLYPRERVGRSVTVDAFRTELTYPFVIYTHIHTAIPVPKPTRNIQQAISTEQLLNEDFALLPYCFKFQLTPHNSTYFES